MIFVEAIEFQLSILKDRKIRAEIEAILAVNTCSAFETTRDFFLHSVRGKSAIDLLKCSYPFPRLQLARIISGTLEKKEGVDLIKRDHFLEIHRIFLIGAKKMLKREGWAIPELMVLKLCPDIPSFKEARNGQGAHLTAGNCIGYEGFSSLDIPANKNLGKTRPTEAIRRYPGLFD
jgi:hypothetical protein